jgi:hypothetical protein
VAKIPTFRRLFKSTWQESFSALNDFMRQVVSALNGRLTFGENFACVVRDVPLNGSYPVYFKWTLEAKPVGAFVIQCREDGATHVVPTDAIYADWEFGENSMIQINGVTGISPTTTNPYTLTLVVITG